MKRNTLLAVVCICVTVIVVANIMSATPEVAIIDPSDKMGHWYDVLCIEENGTANTYSIPVPEFKGFSKKFVAEYYQESGQQFCDSIQDKTRYRHDMGEIQ